MTCPMCQAMPAKKKGIGWILCKKHQRKLDDDDYIVWNFEPKWYHRRNGVDYDHGHTSGSWENVVRLIEGG